MNLIEKEKRIITETGNMMIENVKHINVATSSEPPKRSTNNPIYIDIFKVNNDLLIFITIIIVIIIHHRQS